MTQTLSEREKTVLRYVVHDFIETATPIGSRYISRRHEDVLGLSSATIRNIMSDLEYLGYINHPHTSAGRVPTDLGYRFYLDRLMEVEDLSEAQQKAIRENLDTAEEVDLVLREASRLLSSISRQLCIVTSPHLSSGVFEKLELIPITSNRILVIISLKAGLVRTIMLEVATEMKREALEDIARLMNGRLGGLTLQQIRETFAERVKDVQNEESGLIRLFIDSVDKLFTTGKSDRLHIAGTDSLLEHPEFVNPRDFRSVIELINDEEVIIHVLEKNEAAPKEIRVSIGGENKEERLKLYTVITASYTAGDVSGSLGVIGPKRMPYSKTIPLVDYVARTISQMLSNQNKV